MIAGLAAAAAAPAVAPMATALASGGVVVADPPWRFLVGEIPSERIAMLGARLVLSGVAQLLEKAPQEGGALRSFTVFAGDQTAQYSEQIAKEIVN